ncbi:hypothetical protein DYBT9275_03160 [Dyadobacter sp. CECT 9275]|uniref:DUF4890 domain-containing protein n=1 Tax=Dyadobacter helix TaxID=2822344 RepID=A0A916NCB8_9BACT|nr:hypothetical protein [Dyadobacter sp. CECT 9275]CAG5003467.1 hypothetical protein DYBT9275_03160 [Dyadobacter sp. CECT 9275]
MKKTILVIAIAAIFGIENSFAQSVYSVKGEYATVVKNSRIDNKVEEYQIDKLDRIVNLSRKQENEIKKIENKYDRIAANGKRFQTRQSTQKLEQDKQQEILSVLTAAQRQRLMAYQHGGKFNNQNKNNHKGRGFERG